MSGAARRGASNAPPSFDLAPPFLGRKPSKPAGGVRRAWCGVARRGLTALLAGGEETPRDRSRQLGARLPGSAQVSAKIRRTPGRRSAYRVSRCQRAQGQARSAAKARHARRECAPSCRPGSGWRTGERRKRRAERCRAARGGRGGTAGRPGDAADDDPPPPPFPLDHQQRKHPSSAPPKPINALPGATWEQEGPSEDSLPDRRGAGGRGSCNPKRVANALEQPLRAARDPRCAALSKPRIQLTLRSDVRLRCDRSGGERQRPRAGRGRDHHHPLPFRGSARRSALSGDKPLERRGGGRRRRRRVNRAACGNDAPSSSHACSQAPPPRW